MASVLHTAEVASDGDLRDRIRQLVRSWLIEEDRYWRAELIAAELAASVQHSGHPITVNLRTDGRMARLELSLANGDRPVIPSGYALRVLRALTMDFGESNGSRGGGIWAHFLF